ncbi:MAG: tRNA/rRNA methyltransferase [Bacteroidetes bacterium]|nr:tRNA/rRNA methyltransferase [Bacteroidota bacterium]
MEITFVLTEPAVPENVGAAARAMKTMGFDRLALVNPCDHLGDKARMLAHGSWSMLEQAQIFGTLADAVKNIDLVIGTSAKKRRVKEDYHPCNKLPDIIRSKGNTVKSIALVFGREERGLENEELQLCNIVSTVPMNEPYPSLNLAQAVMIYAYTLSEFTVNQTEIIQSQASSDELSALRLKVKQLLEKTYLKDRPVILNRIRERLNMTGETDVHLLHSVCNALMEENKNRDNNK